VSRASGRLAAYLVDSRCQSYVPLERLESPEILLSAAAVDLRGLPACSPGDRLPAEYCGSPFDVVEINSISGLQARHRLLHSHSAPAQAKILTRERR
jgi:hypothetical protein